MTKKNPLLHQILLTLAWHNFLILFQSFKYDKDSTSSSVLSEFSRENFNEEMNQKRSILYLKQFQQSQQSNEVHFIWNSSILIVRENFGKEMNQKQRATISAKQWNTLYLKQIHPHRHWLLPPSPSLWLPLQLHLLLLTSPHLPLYRHCHCLQSRQRMWLWGPRGMVAVGDRKSWSSIVEKSTLSFMDEWCTTFLILKQLLPPLSPSPPLQLQLQMLFLASTLAKVRAGRTKVMILERIPAASLLLKMSIWTFCHDLPHAQCLTLNSYMQKWS